MAGLNAPPQIIVGALVKLLISANLLPLVSWPANTKCNWTELGVFGPWKYNMEEGNRIIVFN